MCASVCVCVELIGGLVLCLASTVYELAAFVSHMGTSTDVGHYVCHIKKDGRWVIFNDERVALSEQPPLELGYLYLYRRTPRATPPADAADVAAAAAAAGQ